MKILKLLMFKAKSFKISFLLTLLLSYSLTLLHLQAQTWPPADMQGNGSESNPWQLTTPAHLEALALYVNAGNGNETNGKYYKMMNNIDLIGYSQGEGWAPIGIRLNPPSDLSKCFQGHFNGNGNIIQNLTIDRPTENIVALFGYTANGSINNLGLESCNIVGRMRVAGLVGLNGGGTVNGSYIQNCYVIGNVTGKGSYTGGLVATHNGFPIKNCFTMGNVNGTGTIGGLVGQAGSSFNCFSTCSVVGTYSTIGGLIGGGGVEIRNCFVANDSIVLYAAETSIGRISGSYVDILRNNYAYKDMVVQNTIGDITITDGLNTQDGMGVDMELLQSFDFYATESNWNGEAWDIASASLGNPNSVWRICDGEGFPFLRWQKKGCDIFTITATAGSNGTINPLGEVLVNELEDQTFTFSAHTGYHVDSLFIDGVYKPEYISAGKYTFEEVVIDHTIHVTFAEGVGVAERSRSNLQVYPNPTQNKFILDFDGEATIVIYDFFGKELSSQKFNCKTETNISHLPSGVYTIQVFSEGKMIGSSKIIKK